MTGEHDHQRDRTAAYVLGALGADERAEMDDHLRTCASCRQDVIAFAPVPGLLARLDPEDLDPVGEPSADADAVVAAVRSDIARLGRSRRRWRWVAGAAAAAAAVMLTFVAVDDDAPGARRSSGTELAVETASAVTSARVVATEHAWGTYVRVSTEDLPDRESYALWVVDDGGAWERAGSWAPTPGGEADLGGSTRLELERIDRIVVTSTDRQDEVLVAR